MVTFEFGDFNLFNGMSRCNPIDDEWKYPKVTDFLFEIFSTHNINTLIISVFHENITCENCLDT